MTATSNDHPPASPDTDPDARGTVVVGAGLGGLLAAITAAEQRPRARVVVLDPHPPGGRARCDPRDGFTFNRGPRALYVGGPGEAALRSVGVSTRAGGPPDLAGALALHGGRTHRFPGTALASARTTLFSSREKLAVTATLAALWRADPADPRSLAAWLDDRGATGTVRAFVEALVRVATYTDAPGTFAAAPALANARAGVRPGVRYLDGGWQVLVDQLLRVAEARGVEVRRTGARRITAAPGGVSVEADDGSVLRSGTAIVAAGGPDVAARLLGGRPPSWGELAPPVTAACLELGVRGLPSHRFALGIDEPVYASTHSPPADLAPAGHAVVHLMRYHAPGASPSADEDQQRLREIAAVLGIAPGDIVAERFLARMVVASSIPTAAGGGLPGRPTVAVAEHPGVLLAGDWVGPTGLLFDAVASSAVEAGRRAAAWAGAR